MNEVLLILSIVLFIILLLLFMPFHVALVFSEKDIRLKLFNIILLAPINKRSKKATAHTDEEAVNMAEKSEQGEKENEPKSSNDLKSLAKKFSQLREAYEQEKDDIEAFFAHLKKMITLVHYRIVASFGLENPADTGMATGAVYAFFSGMEAYVRNFVTPKKNSYITVTPNFVKANFEIDGEIAVSITLIKLFKMLRLGKNIYKRNKRKVKIILRGGSTYERTSA